MSSTPSPRNPAAPGPRSGSTRRLLTLALVAFLVVACGQRGPLYLPEDATPAPAAAEAEQESTDNDPNLEEDDEETPGA